MNPEDLLKWYTIPPYRRVYCVGSWARRVTFLSQQQRAFNLVWALHATGRIEKGTRVAVVGGGLAGITVAAAADQAGAQVTLFEGADDALSLQRGCRIRFVHPTIYDWPNWNSDEALTDLPFLNWGAGTTMQVAETLLLQWSTVARKIDCRFSHEVKKVVEGGNDLPIVTVENRQYSFDRLVLAVGFGLEQTIPTVPFTSYWDNDNLSRPVLQGPVPRAYLVTGCGDGGATDTFRLRLRDADHAQVIHYLLTRPGLHDIERELQQIEDVAQRTLHERLQQAMQGTAANRPPGSTAVDEAAERERLDAELIGPWLESAYEQLSIRRNFIREFQEQLRADTKVYLNSRAPTPYSLRTSVMNRFLLWMLRKHGDVEYFPGTVDVPPSSAGEPIPIRLVD